MHAAQLGIDVPQIIPGNGTPITVSVTLDPQGDTVGALSGTFSFSSEFFDISDITTRNSIISIWLVPPAVTRKGQLDGYTHISLEGLIPGGFSGVHDPFNKDERVGNIATITLVPKQEGVTQFLLDSVEVRRSDAEGTLLSDQSIVKPFKITELSRVSTSAKNTAAEISNEGILAVFAQSELIQNGAWHVVFDDTSNLHTVDHFEIAESNEYNPHKVSLALWQEASSPYVLDNQSRNEYLHIKAVYADGSFAYKTLPPVENLNKRIILLCILTIISVLVAYLICLKTLSPHAFLLFRKRK